MFAGCISWAQDVQVNAETAKRADSRLADQRPNFIVVFCDNLGYGDIEPFGSQVHRTPALNRMRDRGASSRIFVSPLACARRHAAV